MKRSNQYKLKLLMLQHNIKAEKVAELTHRSVLTVRSWLYDENVPNHRKMQDDSLELLELKLKGDKK
jgi:hypothetical protein